MTKEGCLLLLATCATWANLGHAQTALTIRSSVTASVEYSTGIYTYNYNVANASVSTGSIWTFGVDVSQPQGGAQLSGTNLENGQGALSDLSAAIALQPESVQSVPVAFQAPSGWLVTLSADGTVQWGAYQAASLIVPGQSEGSYQIFSPGLPGIRTFTADPHLDADQSPIPPPTSPNDLQRYLDAVTALENASRSQGLTVAPTAPPSNFDLVQFLQTIQGYKDASLQQGWITNAGVANSLDAKLNAALGALKSQNYATASNILDALLNEVSAQSGKALTPEAVGLLQANVQYLLSKMP